jgi:microcystin-dependent protein
MSLPAIIRRLTSFTAFQQAQGDDSFPGTQVDADLDQTNNAVNGLRAQVAAFVRADGKLGNGVVGRNALAADLQLGMGASRPWDAAIDYLTDETVTRGAAIWQAQHDNTGYDPLLDDGTHWVTVADLSQAVVVADGGIGPDALADQSVTPRTLAPGVVGTSALADASLTRAKAALNLGVVPVGAEIDFAGYSLPAGWLFCAGQAVSRATYADLFAALTATFGGSATIGATTISTGGLDLTGLGLRGAAIEGPGIGNGVTVSAVASSQITLSAAVTATSAAATFRLLPYGRGDGSTTFTLPDRRGRAVFGRDDMGGAAAGRLVNGIEGASLAGAGGAAQVTLGANNLPVGMPGGRVSVSYPPHAYAIRATTTGASTGAGAGVVSELWQGLTTSATQPPDPITFNVDNTNPNGGQPFNAVPPGGVANRIIFAGV